ncbi:MAG TPA: hypothetical protein VF733_01925 [Candidatus Saccharimonadales bacterium]
MSNTNRIPEFFDWDAEIAAPPFDYDGHGLGPDVNIYFGLKPTDDVTSVRAPWHKRTTFRSADGRQFEVGERGARSFIIDPRTGLPITDGFHDLFSITDYGMQYGKGTAVYEAEACEPGLIPPRYSPEEPDEHIKDYPAFLRADYFVVRKTKGPVRHLLAPQPVNEGPERDINAELGRDVFDQTMAGLVGGIAAGPHAGLLRQLKKADKVVSFPELDGTTGTAQALVRRCKNGTNVISLLGTDKRIDEGFHLVKSPGGDVTLVQASFERSWPSAQTGYAHHMQAAQKRLEEYYKELGSVAKAEDGLGAMLRTAWGQLGNISLWRARQILKKSLDS